MTAIKSRAGLSLLELVIALLLVALGLIAVAGASLLAQRTITRTAAIERITRETATVMDSLAVHPRPASGERAAGGVVLRWLVEPDSLGDHLRIQAQARHAVRPIHLAFEVRHFAR